MSGPRPFPPPRPPPFPPTYPPFYKQATDEQLGRPSSYDVQPPGRVPRSRDMLHDIHQLLRSLREDLLEGMEHTSALESRAEPWYSHSSEALATLERAWARAFEASELLRIGDWAPHARARHSQAIARPKADDGKLRGASLAYRRRAVNQNETSTANAASDVMNSTGAGNMGDHDTLRRARGSPVLPYSVSPPSFLPTGPVQGGIEDGYLDEVISWLRQNGEGATREHARRHEQARREAERLQQREELDRLMAEIQVFERDYYRVRPGV